MSRDRAICWDEHSRNQRIRRVIMPSTSAKGHCLGFPLLWGGRGDSGRHKDCESLESGQSSSQDRAKQGARRAWTGIFDCCEHGSGTEVSTQAIHGELIPGKPALPAAVLGELSCPSHSALPFHGNGMWDGLTGHPAEAPLRGVWSSGAAPGAEFSPNTEKRPELKP